MNGEVVKCPVCGTEFEKKSYQQKFCSLKCKDKHHNKKGDRHRKGYYREYNKQHPERILRIMPSLTAYEVAEQDAMHAYLTDMDFRRYVDDDFGEDEWGRTNVDLQTMYENYLGID